MASAGAVQPGRAAARWRAPGGAVLLPLVAALARAEETPGCFVQGWKFSSATLLPNVTQPAWDVKSPELCQAYCKATPKCEVFGYFPGSETCYLGGHVGVGEAWHKGLEVESINAITGPVDCDPAPGVCRQLPGQAFPGASKEDLLQIWAVLPPPNLQCWPKQWQRNADTKCLKPQPYGCKSVRDMAECLHSRDGDSKGDEGGIWIHGEPCAWCGGGLCHSGRDSMCEPLALLLRGEGRVFTTLHARFTFRVASCKAVVEPPQVPGELGCLVPAQGGCKALRGEQACLASLDGRVDATYRGQNMYGQPCVWCGGSICHSWEAAASLQNPTPEQLAETAPQCETFGPLFNGEGRAFENLLKRQDLEIAGCEGGEQKATRMDAPLPPSWEHPSQYADLYIAELSPCDGEAPQVLDDTALGWPGSCLGLHRQLLTPGATCESNCVLNVSCPGWQEISVHNASECWQGLGTDCEAFPGSRTIVRAQRLLHGTYRVLRDLRSMYVAGLTFMFDHSAFVGERAKGVMTCNHTCLSLISCQAWTYSTRDGCMIDAGNLPYPPTAATFDAFASGAVLVVAGEYIQRMCQRLLQEVVKAGSLLPEVHVATVAPPVLPRATIRPLFRSEVTFEPLQIGPQVSTQHQDAHRSFMGFDTTWMTSLGGILAAILLLVVLIAACIVCCLLSRRKASPDNRKRKLEFTKLQDEESLAAPLQRPASPTAAPASPASAVQVVGQPTPRYPFVVVVDRSQGGILGLDVDYAPAGNAIIVNNIGLGGLLHAWNAANPQCKVQPGDCIIEVNGCRHHTEGMMAHLRAFQVLHMVVVPGVLP